MPSGSKDVGASFTDFLVDLVGGQSNVKMAGLAAVEGLDPASRNILDQIKQKIEETSAAGPEQIDDKNDATLSTVAGALARYQQRQKLLNNMQDFYTKKYGTGAK